MALQAVDFTTYLPECLVADRQHLPGSASQKRPLGGGTLNGHCDLNGGKQLSGEKAGQKQQKQRS